MPEPANLVASTPPARPDEPADWRQAPPDLEALAPMHIVGRYRHARRCIDPPCLDLTPVPAASDYEVLIAPMDGVWSVSRLRGSRPRIDLQPIWRELPLGPLQVTVRAWNSDGRLVGLGPLAILRRSPDWDGRQDAALDYRATGCGVIEYLVRHAPEASDHPGMPGYLWHAAAAVAGRRVAHDFQFPALSYPSLIDLFVTGAASGCGDELGEDLLARARSLADFLLDHPAVTDGPLAGAPRSTMDQQGGGGMHEPDRITLVRLGWTGCAMLRLAEATGDARYATYGERLGQMLLDTQQADGSWPYRVRLSDGAVLEPYTAAVSIALLLLERLDAGVPNGPYAAAIDRGLEWVIANPVRTGLWQQMYEDVPTLEPYENLEQWAALETAMLLIRRRHPNALSLARTLVRYVEDQFVLFGDEAVLSTPYLPFTPCVLEQYRCYWPMDFHTANYARAVLALHEATGEPEWAWKAIAAANTIVHCRQPDGRLSTLVPDQRFGVAPPFSDWFNCMAHAADVLLRLGPTLTELGTIRE